MAKVQLTSVFMKWLHQFDLVLLDFDGLLVSSEQLQFEAYRSLCQESGFVLNWNFERFCEISHSSATGLKEKIYAEFPALQEREPSWDILRERKNQIYFDLLKAGKLELLSGVAELLKELSRAGKKRCVVTNSTQRQVEQVKSQIPLLSTLPVWITREQYADPKPAPDAYLKALELLSDPGDKVIGFEDSLRGVLALQSASVSPVLICPKNHPQLKNPQLKGAAHFASFLDIPAEMKFKQFQV